MCHCRSCFNWLWRNGQLTAIGSLAQSTIQNDHVQSGIGRARTDASSVLQISAQISNLLVNSLPNFGSLICMQGMSHAKKSLTELTFSSTANPSHSYPLAAGASCPSTSTDLKYTMISKSKIQVVAGTYLVLSARSSERTLSDGSVYPFASITRYYHSLNHLAMHGKTGVDLPSDCVSS